MKDIKKSRVPLLISFLLPLSLSTANAAAPLWTFTPVSGYPATATVPSGGSLLVKYVLTNQSKKPHTLVMTPIANVTQVTTGSGVCANPVVLAGKQSCTLVLQVSGNASGPKVIDEGPIFCQQGGRFDCYQPSSSDRLRILNSTRFVISLSATPTTLTLQQNYNVAQTVTVTNLGKTTAQNIHATLPSTWTDVTQDASGCATVAPGASCSLLFTAGSSTHTSESIAIQGTNTKAVSISMSVVLGPALSLSQTNLALSVNNPMLNTALTGNSRTLTVTNTGGNAITSVTYTEANNASNTYLSVSPASGAGCTSIASGASCIFTIAPTGTTATPNNTPVVITFNVTDFSSNTNTNSANLYVLSYGSLYQTGYVYSIDDSLTDYPANVSVGGEVLATSYQAYTTLNLPWGATSTGVSDKTSIYGIDELSTTSNPSPTSTTSAPIQNACDGATDGACNTTNIVSYYDAIGNLSSNYSAGVCVNYQSTDSAGVYDDWFLPAICQLTTYSGGNVPASNATCSLTQQNVQSNLYSFICAFGGTAPGCIGSQYIFYDTISSTEISNNPTDNAWGVYFNANNDFYAGNMDGGVSIQYSKSAAGLGVLCSRAITQN